MTEEDIKKQLNAFLEETRALPAEDALALQPVLYYFEKYAFALLRFQEEVEATHSKPEEFDGLKGRLLGILGGLDRDTARHSNALQALTPHGKKVLEMAWEWFSGTVTSGVLRVVAGSLQVQSWSFGVTTGFPSGISTTVTINFKGV